MLTFSELHSEAIMRSNKWYDPVENEEETSHAFHTLVKRAFLPLGLGPEGLREQWVLIQKEHF